MQRHVVIRRVSRVKTKPSQSGREPAVVTNLKRVREFDRIAKAPERPTDIKADVGRLNLVMKALLSLVEKKRLFSDSELIAEMDALDMADGRRDGQLKRKEPPKTCARCGRRNRNDIPTCMYCGKDLGVGLPL
ncbi:MAG: hypothetical protein IT462_05235 [Planctomycetes bacterium]|nr:hypothetical protein [Planctomycetota bacterium]